MKLIISSPNKESLIEACKKFFYSENINIDFDSGVISNKNGEMNNWKVLYKNKRYKLFQC